MEKSGNEGVLLTEYNLKRNEEFMAMMPRMKTEEREALEKSILEYGRPVEPITVWRDEIVDGYTRYDICVKHKLPYEIREIEMDSRNDVKRWILDSHLTRRSLSLVQKVRLAETYKDLYAIEAKANQGTRTDLQQVAVEKHDKAEQWRESSPSRSKNPTRYHPTEDIALFESPEEDKREARRIRRKRESAYRAAELIGISETTYRRVLYILKSGNDELIDMVENGDCSVNKAYNLLRADRIDVESELGKRKSQTATALTLLDEVCTWLAGQQYEQDGEAVTDIYVNQIKDLVEMAHKVSYNIEAMNMKSDTGIISVEEKNNDAEHTTAA